MWYIRRDTHTERTNQPVIPLEKLYTLPCTHRVTIPEDYRDEMGHMNIQYYIAIYDRAAWGLFDWLGVSLEDMQATHSGMFALKQFIQYMAEVHIGETVAVYSRVLSKSSKRLYFMHFMVNESTGKLASTFEVLATHIDMNIRRSAPFTEAMAAKIQQRIDEHTTLDWDAPLCGVLAP